MNNASIAIQILPQVPAEDVIRVVDEAIATIKGTGLNMSVGPFETVVEGEFEQLMELLKECQLACIGAGAPSLMTYVKINYKPEGNILSIEEKIKKHQ